MKHQLLCFLLVLGCIEVVGKLDIDAVDVFNLIFALNIYKAGLEWVSSIFLQLPQALSCVQGRTCVPLNPIDVNVVVLSHFHSEEVGLYENAAVGSDLGSTEASATTSLVASSIIAIASSSALSATSPSLVAVSAITTISRSLVVITSSSILLAASTAALVIVPIHLLSGLNLIFKKKDINNKWTRGSCLKNYIKLNFC